MNVKEDIRTAMMDDRLRQIGKYLNGEYRYSTIVREYLQFLAEHYDLEQINTKIFGHPTTSWYKIVDHDFFLFKDVLEWYNKVLQDG